MQIVGVSVEPFVANACPVVVVSDAESVWPTEGSAACVHALPGVAVLKLGANLIVSAVRVVVTLGHGRTADGSVVWVVTFEAWSA